MRNSSTITARLSIEKIRKTIEYIFAVALIMSSYTMFERDLKYAISDTILSILCSILGIALLVLSASKNKKVSRRYVQTYFISLIVLFSSLVIGGGSFFAGIVKWIVPFMIMMLIVSLSESRLSLWIAFENVMFIICIVSIVLYLIGPVLGIIDHTRVSTFLYDERLKKCYSWFDLQYTAQRAQTVFGLFAYRNTSFFIEAPFYNFLLCLALAIELSYRKNIRKYIVLLFVVGIISTLTTTGILFLIAMLITGLYVRKEKIKHIRWVLLPIVFLIGLYAANFVLEQKFGSVSGSDSISIRYEHAIAFFKAWLDKPLFGWGYGDMQGFFSYTRYQQGYSVGLPALLERCGLFVFLLYIIPWFVSVARALKRRDESSYFLIGTFLLAFLTAMMFKPIFILLFSFQLFMGLNTDNFRNEVSAQE